MRRTNLFIGLAVVLIAAAACTTPAATTNPTVAVTPAGATQAPPATAAATTAAAVTVKAEAIGTAGTILVDGTTGMTLYIFTKDTKDSGTSVCTGGCLETWPALTVAASATPTGDAAVTGALATITRTDDGTLQVTYNGLPLYFFKNDQAPGDLNGVYENWETVAP